MSTRGISLSAALVLLGGSVYLAEPVRAEPVHGCSEAEWYAAVRAARAACDGPASFTGYCENGRFVIETIYCHSQY